MSASSVRLQGLSGPAHARISMIFDVFIWAAQCEPMRCGPHGPTGSVPFCQPQPCMIPTSAPSCTRTPPPVRRRCCGGTWRSGCPERKSSSSLPQTGKLRSHPSRAGAVREITPYALPALPFGPADLHPTAPKLCIGRSPRSLMPPMHPHQSIACGLRPVAAFPETGSSVIEPGGSPPSLQVRLSVRLPFGLQQS